MLGAMPEITPVFSWVRILPTFPDFPLPQNYVFEPTTGAIFLAPFIPFALLAFFVRRGRKVLWIPAASAVGVLLFITLTGWSTHRYVVDFLPLAILPALVVIAVWLDQLRPR